MANEKQFITPLHLGEANVVDTLTLSTYIKMR